MSEINTPHEVGKYQELPVLTPSDIPDESGIRYESPWGSTAYGIGAETLDAYIVKALKIQDGF